MNDKTTGKNEEMVKSINNAVEYVIPEGLTRKINYDSLYKLTNGKLVGEDSYFKTIKVIISRDFEFGVLLDFESEEQILYPIIPSIKDDFETRIEHFKYYFEVINPNNSESINFNWIRPAIVSIGPDEVKLIQKGVICLE